MRFTSGRTRERKGRGVTRSACSADTQMDSVMPLPGRGLVPGEQTRAPDCQADRVDVGTSPCFNAPVQRLRVCLNDADNVPLLDVIADSDGGSDR